MPTAVGPNTKGEENLVFGYDLKDTDNSYRGEPATNLITSGIPGYFGSGGQTLYQNKLYGLKSDSGVFQRNYITSPNNGNNGGLYKNFTTSALNAATRYIRICFDFYMITRYRTFSSSGVGLNGYIGITNTDSTTDAYGWNTTYCNGSGDDWSNDEAYVGKWQKVTLIAELRGDKNPASINAMYIYYDFFTQGEGIFTNFIITEHATFPTGPVRYTEGTRSATQGLIDLTGNSTIDLSNVSFDSNAQMTFDGTNDQFLINIDSWIRNVTDITIEGVVEIPSGVSLAGGPWSILTDHAVNSEKDGFWWHMSLGGGYTYFRVEDNVNGEIGITFGNPTTFAAGNTYHIATVVGSAGVAIYNNGVKVESYSPSFSWANISASQVASLVVGSTFPGYYLNSVTYNVKLYNRALTASEIRANYNAIKGRFNI
jgi:hypothetical protein